MSEVRIPLRLGRFIVLMSLEPTTTQGPCPFNCLGKELKCEALTNVVVTSRRQREILRTIAGVCQLVESECQDGSVAVYLVGVERSGALCDKDWNTFFERIREVSIPLNARELCACCFKGCRSLRRVTFSPSSSLERIGVLCFAWTGVEEVSVPDGVCDLCDRCFEGCSSLRHVTFGPCSSLERIGVSCFAGTGVEEVSVPDGVCDLCDRCFEGCSSLRRVTFGPSSSVVRIGQLCFYQSGLVEFEIPVSVRALGGGAFGECALAGGIMCSDSCCFRAIANLVLSDGCKRCCCSYGNLSSVCIPDSVRELCDHCFEGCSSLRRVTFGPCSSLERIGFSCFHKNRS